MTISNIVLQETDAEKTQKKLKKNKPKLLKQDKCSEKSFILT